jgi:hypothetical protein
VLVVTGRSSLTAILEAEAATAGAPTMGLTGEPGAVAIAAAEATRIVGDSPEGPLKNRGNPA